MGQSEEAVAAWYNHWIALGFEALEAMLDKGPKGRFCHGDAPGLADICLVPQVINSRTYKLDLAPYPTVARIAQTCLALPAFDKALPANQPDAE
jgi:maleylpyruvate isomerase